MSPAMLALVTIGQSPRVDITPDLEPLLAGWRWCEVGALDALSLTEIEALAPDSDEDVLVSRLRNGGHAVMRHDAVAPLIIVALERAQAMGAQSALLMCTGHFPELQTPLPLYSGEELAHTYIAAQCGGRRMGVLAPLERQETEIAARWQARLGAPVLTDHADPYTANRAELETAARRLARAGAELIALDCFGYSVAMAQWMSQACGLEVLPTRTAAIEGFLSRQ